MLFALIIVVCSTIDGCTPVDETPKYMYHSMKECLDAAIDVQQIVPRHVAAMAREISCKAENPES